MYPEEHTIDINMNKDEIVCLQDIECPICLNEINKSDLFINLTCCNKNIHINCLCNWYENKNMSKNRFKQNCFLCTKKLDENVTQIIDNYIYSKKLNENTENYYSDNSETNTDNVTILTNSVNNLCKKIILKIIYTIVIILIIVLFSLIKVFV